jgi:hypothetical protein
VPRPPPRKSLCLGCECPGLLCHPVRLFVARKTLGCGNAGTTVLNLRPAIMPVACNLFAAALLNCFSLALHLAALLEGLDEEAASLIPCVP